MLFCIAYNTEPGQHQRALGGSGPLVWNGREFNLQGNCSFLDGKTPFVSREMEFKQSQLMAVRLLSIRMHSFAVNAAEHCTYIASRQMKTDDLC